MTSTTDLVLTSNATERHFIDSNVLIYMYDTSEPQKQRFAEELVAGLTQRSNGVLSVQVLGEFFFNVTRRIANPLSVAEAERAVGAIGSSSTLDVLDIDMAMVRRAIATHSRYGTTYWDSLIIAAAERAGCSTILSEDYNSGQSYHGILAVNPFAASPT